jgi:hypothetical protein
MITAFRLARVINLGKASVINSLERRLLGKIIQTEKLFTLQKTKHGTEIIEVADQDYRLVKLYFDRSRKGT